MRDDIGIAGSGSDSGTAHFAARQADSRRAASSIGSRDMQQHYYTRTQLYLPYVRVYPVLFIPRPQIPTISLWPRSAHDLLRWTSCGISSDPCPRILRKKLTVQAIE